MHIAGDILARMDQGADPCQDFYQFACGTYLDTTELEGTESKTGTTYEVRDILNSDTRYEIAQELIFTCKLIVLKVYTTAKLVLSLIQNF